MTQMTARRRDDIAAMLRSTKDPMLVASRCKAPLDVVMKIYKEMERNGWGKSPLSVLSR